MNDNEKKMNDLLKMMGLLEETTNTGDDEHRFNKNINLMDTLVQEMCKEVKEKLNEFNGILCGIRQSGMDKDVNLLMKELIATFVPIFNTVTDSLINEMTKNLEKTAKYKYAQYKSYVDAGFSEDQAFAILNKSSSSNDIAKIVAKELVVEGLKESNFSFKK